jgi:hypothetical protein
VTLAARGDSRIRLDADHLINPSVLAAALHLFGLDVRVKKRRAFAAVDTETPLPSTGLKCGFAP